MNGQFRETGNIGYTRHNATTNKTKNTKHHVLDTTMHKQTQTNKDFPFQIQIRKHQTIGNDNRSYYIHSAARHTRENVYLVLWCCISIYLRANNLKVLSK